MHSAGRKSPVSATLKEACAAVTRLFMPAARQEPAPSEAGSGADAIGDRHDVSAPSRSRSDSFESNNAYLTPDIGKVTPKLHNIA